MKPHPGLSTLLIKFSSSHIVVIPILIAILVGALTGITAVAYVKLIGLCEKFYFGTFRQWLGFLGPYAIIFIPAFGSLLAGIWF